MKGFAQALAENAYSIYSWLFFGTLLAVLCWEMAAPLRPLSASTATRSNASAEREIGSRSLGSSLALSISRT